MSRTDDFLAGLRDHDGAWERAREYGIELSLTEWLLTLSPQERLRRHDQALELILAARDAGRELYGFDPRYHEGLQRKHCR